MSGTQTLERSDQTGLSDSTHSTSSSAERYRLDEFDSRPVLCYQYRGCLKTSSQKDLCAWLDKDQNLRVTRKSIPRGTAYVDVKRHDLYLPEEKEQYAEFPNYDSSLASVKVPTLAYWSRMFLGNFQDLYIVSPESSPNSSVDGDSRRVSPTTTGNWGEGSQEDARSGAPQEKSEELCH